MACRAFAPAQRTAETQNFALVLARSSDSESIKAGHGRGRGPLDPVLATAHACAVPRAGWP